MEGSFSTQKLRGILARRPKRGSRLFAMISSRFSWLRRKPAADRAVVFAKSRRVHLGIPIKVVPWDQHALRFPARLFHDTLDLHQPLAPAVGGMPSGLQDRAL